MGLLKGCVIVYDAGNVKFINGGSEHSWFKSCSELVNSRFLPADFEVRKRRLTMLVNQREQEERYLPGTGHCTIERNGTSYMYLCHRNIEISYINMY